MARPCVLDASLLIALGKVGRLDLLSQTPDYEWHIGPAARAEVRKPEAKGAVEHAILTGVIQPADLDSDDSAALALLVEWSELVDPGEAECIAIALSAGWLAGLEDRAAQRLLDRRAGAGRWINCANVLCSSVRSGSLTLPEADVVFASLDVFAGYAKRGIRSLAQVDPRLRGEP